MPCSGPWYNQKDDYIRFVQTRGARLAKTETVLSDFKLKVPSLIRGSKYIVSSQKRPEEQVVKTVQRPEDNDPTRRVATRPTPVFSGKLLREDQENQDNCKRARKSSLLISSSIVASEQSSSSSTENSLFL
ncbi:hypothetical protein DPMN_111757 [Dreissena polymorpha]|uniref:Uncharacterized protein n=1 Tax=Dreissena polymorpha TaxID=45954 RepID=A0A9D4QPB0_DREPO|nr:hypothetical protein DPMN_111757 [Dreissena polymorpha]